MNLDFFCLLFEYRFHPVWKLLFLGIIMIFLKLFEVFLLISVFYSIIISFNCWNAREVDLS